MEETPEGTPVGVEDPYAHAGVCDHCTGEGTCRFAFEHPETDPEFARQRRVDEFACPVVSESGPDWEWADCPHFRSRSTDRECQRCGLTERRMAHDEARPLLEEHHLSYPGGERPHEITVYLCRWCHAKVHDSFARVTDDASPDPAAIAASEGRKSAEMAEFAFETAAERHEDDE
jgi:hypothetical protein